MTLNFSKFADNNFGIEAIDIHAWFQSAVCLEECEVAVPACPGPDGLILCRLLRAMLQSPVLLSISDTKQRWIIRGIRQG